VSNPGPALVGCPECDLLQRPVAVAAGDAALCGRCGARLSRAPVGAPDRILPLALAAMIALGVAVLFPIVILDLRGTEVQTTLFGTAEALYADHMAPLAVLVLATTIVYPVLALFTLAFRNSGQPALRRLLRAVQPWCMVEVFVLGVLVAYAKLAHMVPVAPGAGALALGVFVVLWAIMQREANGDAERTFRKPYSLARTWAFLLAALALYVPANLLPVMHTELVSGAQDDTILSGIAFLWKTGSWPLALVVFVASISVPLLKMLALGGLATSVRIRSKWRPRVRARIYRALEFIGRWSMLDIYVTAILVALVQAKALARIHAGPGALAFAAVVILTMAATMSFDPRLIWDSESHAT